MKNIKIITMIIAVSLVLAACSGETERNIVDATYGRDTKSPVLLAVSSESETLIRLSFNEPVVPYGSSFGVNQATSDGNDLLVRLKANLPAGTSTDIKGRVCDLNGNSTGVSVKAWGFNRNPASLLINEFTTAGSGKSPDRTELLITAGGSLTGMAVYDGIPGNYRTMVVLDEIKASKGGFVVIWWTDSLPDGVQRHPSENVWNICSKSQGLSENNGIITVASSPSEGTQIVDCIAYSTAESTVYEGWGTKEALTRYTTAKDKQWLKNEVVNPKGSTATRSVSRTSQGTWVITASGGCTFGQPNN